MDRRWHGPRAGLLAVAGALVAGLACDGLAQAAQNTRTYKMKITDRVPAKVRAFPLEDVRLLDGPFKHAMERDAKYLLSLEPDRLLSRFREYAGLKPKAPSYGGWESRGVSGHTLGHYLSACSMMYASTGDLRFRQRVEYIVGELNIVQQKYGNGYVGAIPDGYKTFQDVAAGNISTQGFDLNGGWVPWYTMHKLFAGLLDTCRYTGSATARTVLVRLGNWADTTTAHLTPAQLQTMLACEHGGMMESLADVYALTGEPRHLAASRRFYHQAVLDPLSRREDRLTGLHANTQIPKVIGAARLYELTGERRYQTIADYFWNEVTTKRSFVIGGNSDFEHFPALQGMTRGMGPDTAETCNTYNMLKLTRHLFQWEPRARYMDYYERALYNHILASQNPETGMMCYYVPLRAGSTKQFSTPFDSFWCCVGTGIENHAKYGDTIYSHDAGKSLYVNLFIASTLDWKAKGVRIRQETRFPDDNIAALRFTCDRPTQLAVSVRHPYWATSALRLCVNGKPVTARATASGYESVTRT